MENEGKMTCSHCRGVQYVLAYWLEITLDQHGIHMTEIPPDVFKLVPIEDIFFCHCHILVTYIRRNEEIQCDECDGTTWRFTEPVELENYRHRKVSELSPDEITSLPCEYFERCPCADGDQSPRGLKRKELLRSVLELTGIKIPKPTFAF